MEAKKRAVIYARVSSEKEMQLSAFENQLQWYDDIEMKMGEEYQFVGRYTDKGVTGTAAKKRPDFMRMIEDAKTGKFDIILTREVSRFARNTVESLTYTRELAKYNVEVFFINDGIHSMKPEDAMKLQLMSMIAEEESRRDSERAKAGLYVARQNETSVWGNGNIMGYDRPDGRKGDFVINEEQAETVIMIKNFYLYEDMSLNDIKIKLEQLGRKTATGSKRWYASTISRILENPFYAGKQRLCQQYSNNYLEQKRMKNKKENIIYKDTHMPTLFTWEEYEAILKKKALNVMISNKGEVGRKPEKYFWSKKLLCKCGSTYSGYPWRDGYCGFRCANQRVNKSKKAREKLGLSTEHSCDLCSVPEWKLELMATKILKRVWSNHGEDIEKAFLIIQECFKVGSSVDDAEIEAIHQQMSKYNTRIENLKEMRLDGEISKEEYRIRLSEFNENLKHLEQQRKKLMQQMGSEFDVEKQLKNIHSALNEMIDFSKPVLDRKVLDKFIDLVYHQADYDYKWFLKLGEQEDVLIPEEYQIKMVKKNSFVPTIIIKDKRKKLFDMSIDFEEAKAYRKANGSYMRQTAWDDLHMEVYA